MINKKNKFKKLLILFVILSLSFFSFAYFTNNNYFFELSRVDDGNGGYALQRNSFEFADSGCGIGTLLDTVTGLCWDKDMRHNGGTIKWSLDSSYPKPAWNDINKNYTYPVGRVKTDYPAFNYCDSLVLGDYDDWRVPTINEFITLINETVAGGSICANLQDLGFTNCQNSRYWTEEESQWSTISGGVVEMNTALATFVGKANWYYVLCVRRN